jgi:hypothetical protein
MEQLMKTQAKIAAIVSICLLGLAMPVHATLLLSDNFDDNPNNSAATVNNNLGSTQGGSLATVSYSVQGANWTAQHSNGSRLLVATSSDGNGNGSVSLNNDFATQANAANQPLQITFNIHEVSGYGDTTRWVQFNVGNAQNLDVGNGGVGYGMIFRVNTDWSSDTLSGNWAEDDLVTVVLSDTAGTGSAFNGNGSRADVYFNNVFQGTESLTQQTIAYVTFSAYNYGLDQFGLGTFDNLNISLVPEPNSLAMLAFGMISLWLFRRKR